MPGTPVICPALTILITVCAFVIMNYEPQMKRYTIGFIDHDPAVHQRHLGPSLAGLQGQFDILSTTSAKCPAANYNDMIARCATPYLILTHQDVAFSPDLLECIDRTMSVVFDWGALGMVGVDSKRNYLWSRPDCIAQVDTLDCCFIVIRKDLGVLFDASTFDELHQYVEDYCAQLSRQHGKRCYTILTEGHQITQPPWPSYLFHYGATYEVLGSCWGLWNEYHNRLLSKWPGIQTT